MNCDTDLPVQAQRQARWDKVSRSGKLSKGCRRRRQPLQRRETRILQTVVKGAADACGIEAEPYPVRVVHAVRRAVPPSVEGVLDEIGGIAVREAEGLVNAGSEGGHTVCDGRAWAWGP